MLLVGLQQILSPNKAETGLISGKHILILGQPPKETGNDSVVVP